jgi:hypothetical protein
MVRVGRPRPCCGRPLLFVLTMAQIFEINLEALATPHCANVAQKEAVRPRGGTLVGHTWGLECGSIGGCLAWSGALALS